MLNFLRFRVAALAPYQTSSALRVACGRLPGQLPVGMCSVFYLSAFFPMHIVIDACCLGRKKTGNETYIRGLLSGLEAVIMRNVELGVRNSQTDSSQQPAINDQHSSPAPSSHLVIPSSFKFQLSAFRLTVLTTEAYTGGRAACFDWVNVPLGNFLTRNFLTIPRVLEGLRPDLYHGVYWSRFFAQPVPTVLMVHDLSFVSFPQGFRAHEQWVYSNLVRACARSARHILTVSNFSKQELMTHWGIPDDSITVTYDGLDACYGVGGPASKQIGKSEPYVLYLGNLHPRKNIVRLLEGFVKVRERGGFSHRLKIVGQATWMADDVFSAVRESGLVDQVDFTGYVSYEQLTSLYQNADVCVYPSLYEGFGLPVLEAMACGCPVVCSSTTSIPEVAGEACILVNPESVEDIAAGIESVLRDPAVAKRLRERGPVQAAKFTWEACAQATLVGYRKALSTSRI